MSEPATVGESFLAHPARALRVAVGMLALVVLMAILVPEGPLGLDRSWASAMQHLETPLLTDLALAFNWLGRGIGRALGLTLMGLLLLRRRRWLALAAFAVAESLAPSLSVLLKALIDRPRPPGGLVHAAGPSFPSGHATYAGATCVALVLLFTTTGARRRLWWALAVLGVVGMAWSRTYLQVHWLTDVIAGALLGSGISLLVFAVAQRHHSRGIDGVVSRRSSRTGASLPGYGEEGGRAALRWTSSLRGSPASSVKNSRYLPRPATLRALRLGLMDSPKLDRPARATHNPFMPRFGASRVRVPRSGGRVRR